MIYTSDSGISKRLGISKRVNQKLSAPSFWSAFQAPGIYIYIYVPSNVTVQQSSRIRNFDGLMPTVQKTGQVLEP